MLIIGAKGHAKEILEILIRMAKNKEIIFYDDISNDLPELLYGHYRIIRSVDGVKDIFKQDNRFILGLGNPLLRYQLAKRFLAIGGALTSLISSDAIIGSLNVVLETGLNVMSGVYISNEVHIGEGTLVNAHVTIHHDSKIGKYCEISPGVHITGACSIGKFCIIGTRAVLLPRIKIGDNVVVGAGAVVTEDVESNTVVVGMPAKVLKKIEPIVLH